MYRTLLVLVLVANTASAQVPLPCVPPDVPRNQSGVSAALYFESRVRDEPQCAMRVVNGRIAFDPVVTNPAMSCPDRFAWKLFLEAVQDGFWAKWATDTSTFPGCNGGSVKCSGLTRDQRPAAPLPLCTAGASPAACCNPDSRRNPGYDNAWNPGLLCPQFPGDHVPAAQPPMGQAATTAHTGPKLIGSSEPGRAIRQAAAEIVFRNRQGWDYIFRNDLYNQEGLARVYANVNANVTGNMPYRSVNQTANLFEIKLPIGTVSVKTNWISREFALQNRISDNPPHIKMPIRTPVAINSLNFFNGVVLQPGEYWLVSMHVSSKDTPHWTWGTFEHVNSPARCDLLGCNDSFAYESADAGVARGQSRNFTAPHVKSDDLCVAFWVFDSGKTYPSGGPSAEFTAVLRALGIGTGRHATPPSAADVAWTSYRLKGAMNSFTDEMGHPSRVGNSVTEGGFVSNSGCMSCHARASIGPKGTGVPPISIFTNTLSDAGYSQSVSGPPNPAWFHRDSQPPLFHAVPADFVWGFFAARCLDPKFDPVACFLTPRKP